MPTLQIYDYDGNPYTTAEDGLDLTGTADVEISDGVLTCAAGVDVTNLYDDLVLIENHAYVSRWISRSKSTERSHSRSRQSSRSRLSGSRSRSNSRASGSRSRQRSRSISASRSQSRASGSRSRQVSRSRSSELSKSRASSRSRHGSLSRWRVLSRSRSAYEPRSHSHSRSSSKSISRSHSKSVSTSAWKSRSKSRSVSGSGSTLKSKSRSQLGSKSRSKSRSGGGDPCAATENFNRDDADPLDGPWSRVDRPSYGGEDWQIISNQAVLVAPGSGYTGEVCYNTDADCGDDQECMGTFGPSNGKAAYLAVRGTAGVYTFYMGTFSGQAGNSYQAVIYKWVVATPTPLDSRNNSYMGTYKLVAENDGTDNIRLYKWTGSWTEYCSGSNSDLSGQEIGFGGVSQAGLPALTCDDWASGEVGSL